METSKLKFVKATSFGNSSHIVVPKEYINRDICYFVKEGKWISQDPLLCAELFHEITGHSDMFSIEWPTLFFENGIIKVIKSLKGNHKLECYHVLEFFLKTSNIGRFIDDRLDNQFEHFKKVEHAFYETPKGKNGHGIFITRQDNSIYLLEINNSGNITVSEPKWLKVK